MSRFQEILLEKQFTVIVRKSKGSDIGAACGQLQADFDEAGRHGEGNEILQAL
jgi:23S rRNA (adenine2503-C2)-methyltransferase